MRRSLLLVCCLVCQAFPVSVQSADKPMGTVAATEAEADRDYAMQGEYVGSVEVGLAGARVLAVQVIALGDGQFGGQFLVEGLPGAGWNKVGAIPCEGKWVDQTVVLSSRTYIAAVNTGGVAELRYAQGGRSVIGTLRKVERTSPTLGVKAPCDALNLFDGSNTTNFKNGRLTSDGYLAHGTETLAAFRDFSMHLEFRTPYMPKARGQARGNSGVYIQGRYEVQVLDSFGLAGLDNECGGLYKTRRPDVNMCLPPLAWQTYDICFTAARFDSNGKKTASARITVLHNGVAIHNDVEIPNKTGGGLPEADSPQPIKLQDHGNPVAYRNIWLVDLSAPKPCCPCVPCCPTCPSKGGRRCSGLLCDLGAEAPASENPFAGLVAAK